MPRIVRIKTLIVKIIGVITSVVGGLACGKEGPMIHSGAVVAAGISQGKSTTLRKDLGVFNYFREDHEKRDFVSGGAAAGVAAAFGAPVGGVLFSLEEGASFWNQSLTWRIFFASMVSTFTLNLILSAYHGHPGQLSFSGLLNFGKFESLNYDLFELAIFVMMGGIGGILGAVFNLFNYKLTVFRIRYVNTKVKKIMEAVIAAMVSTAVPMLMIYFINECKPLETDPTENPVQMFCGDGQYNTVAALWLQVPERSVRALLHDPPAALSFLSLGLFIMVYFLMAVWTFGLSVSGGLFIPSLLIGAAWGRFFSQILQFIFPGAGWIDPGKYALIGAAAQLGGIVRMTISLTIILIEATGDITFGLPLMITLITAKWTGDFFSEGIYDYHIQLSGVPLLAWEPPPLSGNIYANQVMSYPVVTFSVVETVGNIIDNLSNLTHNGFPVIDSQPLDEVAQSNKPTSSPKSCGHLCGLILRDQLIVLLLNKAYKYPSGMVDQRETINMFRNEYPRYPRIEQVDVAEEDRHLKIDLRPYMNPSPYVVQHVASLPRVFRLFRALGLRHLIIVDDMFGVVGMVTRKDLARYRVWRHHGRIGLEELKISANFKS